MEGRDSALMASQGSALALSSVRPAEQTATASHLSSLEQSVIALSLFDARSTAFTSGLFSRLLSKLIGVAPPNRLASRRLETLRCYSIVARESGGCPASCDVERMKHSGFSDEKIREVDLLVARMSGMMQMKSVEKQSDRHRS